MTGAELKAWRERLGKDEAWIEAAVQVHVPGLGCGSDSDGRNRRCAAESTSDTRYHCYGSEDIAAIRTVYRAALEAEEARQRAQAEPVCPEGVQVWVGLARLTGAALIALGSGDAAIIVHADGRVETAMRDRPLTPECLEYAAALSRYRAARHVQGAAEKQRKQDAVRAAEAALDAACHAEEAARTAWNDAAKARYAAQSTLCNARREAGL